MKPAFIEKKFIVTFIFVTSLFLLWGMAISMGETLNKHFQDELHLSKSQSSLVQFSVFGAYAIMCIPAGLFMKRFGYKNGVLLGLGLYAAGAFLFAPAASAESFPFFRIALFILACGLATLETVAHPFVASLGDQRTSDRRINFGQSFNGLGAVIGPLIGTFFLFHSGSELKGLDSVKYLYVSIGVVIMIVGVAFSFVNVPPLMDPHSGDTDVALNENPVHKKLFQNKHFIYAVIAQFFNVAAQGGTWAYFINYGIETMPGLQTTDAGYFFALSMAGMMCGRFISTFLMRYIAPNKLLAIYACCNAVLCIIIAQRLGWPSFVALIMLNFFMSIMFPTIFSLGLKDLGPNTQRGASFIAMGVVGGAIFPRVMGLVADTDIAKAYYLPIICYAVIFMFGYRGYRVVREG